MQKSVRRATASRRSSCFPGCVVDVLGRFDHTNLQLLEVHHKNSNHDDNPPDGSNWELLCTYCHEHEHSKLKDAMGRVDRTQDQEVATFNPFANLKDMLKKK
ncbi:MAG: YajD family HNH nuclease [Nitrosomonas sp.]